MKFWQLEDGRRMAYREAGDGPPLVLLHGWAMSSAIFSGTIAALADRCRVLAPDLRGHGASEGGDGYRFSDLAADLRHWLEGLGLSGATVLGWSLGGQLLLTLYPDLRERIARLILVASTPAFAARDDWTHGLPPTRIRVMARNLKRDPRRTVDDFFALQFDGEKLAPGRRGELVASLRQGIPLPNVDAAQAGLETLRTSDQRRSLVAIDCPALVVHGESDAIVPVGAGRYLARNLPQARLTILPGAGHAPFLSRPEETFELWRAFIP